MDRLAMFTENYPLEILLVTGFPFLSFPLSFVLFVVPRGINLAETNF